MRRQPAYRHTTEIDGSSHCRKFAAHGIEHRGFTRAVRADNAEYSGRVEVEREPVENGEFAGADADAVEDEARRRVAVETFRCGNGRVFPPASQKARQRVGEPDNPSGEHQDDDNEKHRHQHFPKRQCVAQLRGERADK